MGSIGAGGNPPSYDPGVCRQGLERGLRTGAEMADRFGGAQAAQPAAAREVAAMGEAVEKAAGIEIAGARGIDELLDRFGRDRVGGVGRDDDRAALAARQRGDLALAAHGTDGGVEILGLEERADLGLVGDENIDMAGEERAEGGAVASAAEG